MPYCIYLRKSRADTELEAIGEMETLARHEKTLLELAKKLKLNITEIYKEIVSGDTIADRPVVQQVLDEVEQGLWDGVLVMEIERLARGDNIDQGIVARAFKLNGTKIITPSKTYDPDNEFDEEFFEFGLFMSRREYKTIKRRIYRGRVASVKEGKFVGSVPPYGYDKIKIKDGKGYMLIPNENEKDVVKLIYKLYLQGNGMTEICNKLDGLGIKPRNRDMWSKSTVRDILKNPVYIGKIRWSYRQEKLKKDGTEIIKVRNINNECILVDGLHEALISNEDYDQVQKNIKSHITTPVKKDLKLKNPFTGLLFCAKCGSKMTRLGENKRNRYDSVKCSNRYCTNVSAPIYLVEKKALESINKWLEDHKLSLEPKTNNNSENNINNKALEAINFELLKIKNQIEKTYDLLEQGIYTSEIFTKRNKALQQKLEILKLQKIKIEDDVRSVNEKTPAEFVKEIQEFQKAYNFLLDAKDKNILLNNILDRIEYDKDRANTRGNIDNDNFRITVFPKIPKK